MGCITSKSKLENFRVRARTLPNKCCGYLELTPRELYFYSNQGQQTVWQLQHLRRYGINADVFSFEAGRRCMSGPGIYTFRCQQAESFYQLFQRYVNQAAATDDPFLYADRDREHPSHTLGRGTTDALTSANTNNYLEPAPLAAATMTFRTTMMRDSFSSSPLDSSPDSLATSPSFPNEAVHFPCQQATAAYGNVYLEQPFRLPSQQASEHNNNNNTMTGTSQTAKRARGDAPPEECAPILSPGAPVDQDAVHMYANINMDSTLRGGYKGCCRDKPPSDAERCYENLSRADLPPLLLPSAAPPSAAPPAADATPATPGAVSAAAAAATANAVNYIVLDLDQPRSPTQSSPCFGSGLSLADDRAAEPPPQLQANPNATATHSDESQVAATSTQQQSQVAATVGDTECTLGCYSTIDFIKTCALIKASGVGDTETDHEESRITRHSHNKCMRKAYSISEWAN